MRVRPAPTPLALGGEDEMVLVVGVEGPARGATALAIAPKTRLLKPAEWVIAVELAATLVALLVADEAADEDDDGGDAVPNPISISSGPIIWALCITSRYAAPRRLLSPSSSESVIARYAYCKELDMSSRRKLIIVFSRGACPHN